MTEEKQDQQQGLDARECALIAAKAADEKKATDIMIQQVGVLVSAPLRRLRLRFS